MPQDLRLTRQQEQAFNRALVSSNHTRVAADLLDRNRQYVGPIKNALDGKWAGQVDLDVSNQSSADGSTTGSIWSAELSTIDPDNNLHLDSRAIFLDRLLRIIWSIFVPEMEGSPRAPDGFVDVTLFCGPCSAPVVAGDILTLEAQGMELWARGAVRAPVQWPRGMRVTDVIHDIWVNHIGEPEAWVDIPTLPDLLPSNFRLTTDDEWWGDGILYLAETINCDAFYTRTSAGRLRQRPTQAVYVLRDGPRGAIINIPQTSTVLGTGQGTDIEGTANLFVVIGQAKPSGTGGKPPAIVGQWPVPAGNRFSAQSTGHPGYPYWRKDVVNLPHVHTVEAAQRIARLRGRRALQLAETATDETVVVPHLDPFDRYRRQAEGADGVWDFVRSSVPLDWSPDSPMTWGFTRQVSSAPRRHRH